MPGKKTAVIAIGGNSLIRDRDHQRIEDQYEVAKETTCYIADMIEAGWNVAIGHGNGPQVGFILRQSEVAARVENLPETPLDVCGAESQGLIGYLLQQNLQNELFRRKIQQNVATVITQVLVDINDPAFKNPSKPIGGFMTEEEARRRAAQLGWTVVEDAGRGWRRVVASPFPKEVVELDTIKALINAGVIVITVGGGGIPVYDKGNGDYVGAPAVIDKDFASSLLAQEINADLFIISTAVEKVALNFGKPDQQWIDRMTVAQAKAYMAEGHFARGSMLPKIQAILNYLEHGGKQAFITNPENIGRALKGETGTWIVP
ncbi:MAG TPA: carbamate kinase [Anaerolinea thermolimosa]|uniref:Carbamate kinase n=1 Tax=Anaerolinea thermolimosa TaxID=229919 RepID=A0A3D1JLE1_9CHLR|nr:carbamate kinase [Anaerolinea thermolimosa]